MNETRSRESKHAIILAAASDLFDGRRFDEVTLDEIAVAAGVGKGTLYLYFKNKEDLFAEMAVEGMNEMAGRIREIRTMDGSYKDRLFLFGSEFSAFLARRHGMMRVMHQMQSELVNRKFHKHLSGIISAIQALLQAGIEEKVLRREFKVEELRCALVGPLLLKVRREMSAGEKIEVIPLLNFFWDAAAVETNR
jgi:AcrR family transcriptional regulator